MQDEILEINNLETINKCLLSKALGQVIKHHRKLRNESMYKLAAECSMSRNTWRLIEEGISKDVCLSTLWRMAEALDIPPETIVAEVHNNLGSEFSISGLI